MVRYGQSREISNIEYKTKRTTKETTKRQNTEYLTEEQHGPQGKHRTKPW